MKKYIAAILTSVAILIPTTVGAVGQVLNHCVLTWDASTSPDVASYNIYLSTTAGGAGVIVGIATVPVITWTCPASTAQGQYYATVTAVDAALNESVKSNEVPFVLDTAPPTSPVNLRVTPR